MSEPALEARTGMNSQEEKAGRCAYEIRESQPELKTTLLNTVMNYLRGVNEDQSAWEGDRRWRHEVSKQIYSSWGRFSCEQENGAGESNVSSRNQSVYSREASAYRLLWTDHARPAQFHRREVYWGWGRQKGGDEEEKKGQRAVPFIWTVA